MWSIRNLEKVYPECDHIITSLRNSSLAYDANQCEMICGLILISNFFMKPHDLLMINASVLCKKLNFSKQ